MMKTTGGKIEAAESKLVSCMSLTKGLDLPPTHQGRFCANWWQNKDEVDAQREVSRHRKLVQKDKRDDQLLKEIFQILMEFPELAKRKYDNFSQESIFPLWYLVLHGGSVSMMEQVHAMHPNALEEPMICQDTSEESSRTYTLLDAACIASPLEVPDDVVHFLARKGPPSALVKGFRKPPFIARLFRKPINGQVYHASLELIRELVFDSEWNHMGTLNSLFNEGYSSEVLQYAVDRFLERPNNNSSSHRHVLKLTHSSWQQNSGCCMDAAKAQLLGQILPMVHAFHCKPPRWTRQGFLQTCRVLSSHSHCAIKELDLKLQESPPSSMDGRTIDWNDKAVTYALEDIFATNTSIDTLRLSVSKSHFEAIARGLAQGRHRKAQNLKLLVVKIIGESQTVDITHAIQNLLLNGCVQSLCLQGPPSSYQINISTICNTLLQDTTLQTLEMDAILKDAEVDQLVQLLLVNATLQQLVVHNSAAGIDYTGFTTCADEMTVHSQPWCSRVHCLDRANDLLYYMRLNRCGRAVARCPRTTRNEFVRLLSSAVGASSIKVHPRALGKRTLRHASCTENQDTTTSSTDLNDFNVVFGLLMDAGPSLWNPHHCLLPYILS